MYVCLRERAREREGGREPHCVVRPSLSLSHPRAPSLSFALLSTVPIVQEKLKPTTVSVEKPVETVQQTVKPVEVIKEVPITTQVRTCSFLSIARNSSFVRHHSFRWSSFLQNGRVSAGPPFVCTFVVQSPLKNVLLCTDKSCVASRATPTLSVPILNNPWYLSLTHTRTLSSLSLSSLFFYLPLLIKHV